MALGVGGARQVSAATQHQALCALGFLDRHVLGQHLGWLDEVVRAKRPQRLPVVWTRPEGNALLRALDGIHWSMASRLSGAGLRLLAWLRLRVQAIDFASHQILVRAGKGHKDRRTMRPASGNEPLAAHIAHGRQQHQHEVANGVGRVDGPGALPRKYPHANSAWDWQGVFPASQLSLDPFWTGRRAPGRASPLAPRTIA